MYFRVGRETDRNKDKKIENTTVKENIQYQRSINSQFTYV